MNSHTRWTVILCLCLSVVCLPAWNASRNNSENASTFTSQNTVHHAQNNSNLWKNLSWIPSVYASSDEPLHVQPVPKKQSVLRRIKTKDQVIALTFDDGPSQTFTPKILQLLEYYHAKATFFVIGSRLKNYPQLAKKELALHDEIANHTYTHVIVEHLSAQKIKTELKLAHEAILQGTGNAESPFFRPPRGHFNQRVLKIVKDNGYQVVLWSIDSGDWSNPGVHQIVTNVLKKIHGGDILLFHDQGGNRQQTIDALKRILPELEKRGFQFITVSQLLQHEKQ